MHKYSKTTDLIYPVALLSKYKDLPGDLVDISDTDAAIHMGNDIPDGKRLVKNKYPFELEDIPAPTGAELATIAQSEMITELNWCDLQIKLHASSDKRAVSTTDDIYAYARACRDYVQNVNGELTIMTDKPVRPS